MPIFKMNKTKASQITLKNGGFGSEAELRDFFSENLEEILGVRFREPIYKSDTKKIAKDVMSNEWGYKGMIKFTSDSNVDYFFNLVKESYESTL